MLVKDDNRRRELEWAFKSGEVNHFVFVDEISEVKLGRKPGQEFRLLHYRVSAPLLFHRTCPHSCGYKTRSPLKGVIEQSQKHLSQNRH